MLFIFSCSHKSIFLQYPISSKILLSHSLDHYSSQLVYQPLVLRVSTRDLHVLKHILTLVGTLGIAGLPSLILVIQNVFSLGEAPVSLYLITALTISVCTNIQISFIFAMNKKVRIVFLNHLRHIFYCDFFKNQKKEKIVS